MVRTLGATALLALAAVMPGQQAAAQNPEGQISEVNYLFPRPGPDKTPVPKVTFVTKAHDLGCGVGYYK